MDFLNNIFSGVGNLFSGMFGGGGGGGRQVASAMGNPVNYNQTIQSGNQGGGSNFLNHIFKNPSSGMAGLGALGIGQLLNRPQKSPDFMNNPQVQALNNWSQTANHPMDPNVAQAMQNTLGIQNEQQLRNLRDVYKNLRPGTDYTTDSNYQRDLANLNRGIATQNADAMAGAQFTSNQQNLGNMTNMAQLGVGQQMYGDAQKAQRQQQQNQMFGDIGSMFLQNGLGNNNNWSQIAKLFGGG